MENIASQAFTKKTLVNILGVVYIHKKTSDGGDIYLTQHGEKYEKYLDTSNWYERKWFTMKRTRLLGTSAVYRVPTRTVDEMSLDLVVKHCRVGEEVPLNTHTLEEFCNAEFNSPWEEFSLVMELREGGYNPEFMPIRTQFPLAIYVPPERMQLWQSGRSRAKINRIRARHPGIDLDILKQYKMIYMWIRGQSITEVFKDIDLDLPDSVEHLKAMNNEVHDHLNLKGYYVADMKPEHVIIHEQDVIRIRELSHSSQSNAPQRQVEILRELVHDGQYSVIDYELLFRTPEHQDKVMYCRRHSYLDDQCDRFVPAPVPDHLWSAEIRGVPYICGHSESTGGYLWVVGRNARLFDYFLPERWRKTPSLSLSASNEVCYTVTKDNIHLVWKTSRVGELPDDRDRSEEAAQVARVGYNSPFEAFAISYRLNQLGIPCVYVRAIYMTGSEKVEPSEDLRRYESHRHLRDPEGNTILNENRNYITILGYYNGPDTWVPEHEDALYTPIDIAKAIRKGLITETDGEVALARVVERLKAVGYDGSLLTLSDLLLALDGSGELMRDDEGNVVAIICDLELIVETGTLE